MISTRSSRGDRKKSKSLLETALTTGQLNPRWTNISGIGVKISDFSFSTKHSALLTANYRPFYSEFNVPKGQRRFAHKAPLLHLSFSINDCGKTAIDW